MDILAANDSVKQEERVYAIIRRGKRSTQTGAVLVEFAFVLIFFLVMLFGIIQYSIIMSTLSQLQETTREGLRYYTVHYSDATANNETISYMQAESAGTFLQNNDITVNSVTVNPVTNGITGAGEPYTLTFSYNLHKRVFFPVFVPGMNVLNNDTIVKTATGIAEQ